MKCKKQIIISIVLLIGLMLFTTKSMATNAIVNTETLNLRKEASTESDVVSLLNMGDKLEIIEESGDWYKVTINNKTGYVHKDYIKVEDTENNNQEVNQQEDNNVVEENNIEEQNDINEVVEEPKVEENTDIKEEKSEYEPKQTTLVKDTKCYILPLINSNVLSDMKKGENITILNEVNGWLYIETDEINAWIITSSVDLAILDKDNAEQVEETTQEQPKEDEQKVEEKTEPEEIKVTKIEEKTMYVNTPSIYMRKGPGTDHEVVDSLILNSSVTVTGEVNDWYEVKISDKTGFIAKRLLSNKKQEESTTRDAEERQETSQDNQSVTNQVTASTSKGQEIVNYAKQYLGCKYVYGGSGPSTFDCSGFTMYVYKHFGVSLSHSATAQSKKGSYVAKENLQPGDLVFFKDYETMDGIGHCGIYIGDGNFIHASSGTGYCVKISTLTSGSYLKRYETARRVI